MLLGVQGSVWAQQKPLEQDEVVHRNSHEETITSALLPYISEKDFIVHVTYKMDSIQEFVLRSDTFTDHYYKNLPGILDISRFFPQQKDSPAYSGNKVSRIRLRKSKIVEVLLSDAYGGSDVSFIANLIKIAVPFNEKKGDSIIISTVRFPKWQDLSQELQKKDSIDNWYKDIKVPPMAAGPTYNNTVNTTEPRKNSDPSDNKPAVSGKDGNDNIFQLALIASLLLIIGLLAYLAIKMSGKKKGKVDKKNKQEPTKPEPGLPPVQTHTEAEKQQMIALFIKSPKAISSIIESEVLANGQEALTKYVKAIAAVNPDLYHLLGPHMNSVTFANLVSAIQEQTNSGDHATEEISQVVNRLKTFGELDNQGIFSFLSRINDKQLMFLLRDEHAETIAITIAQLNAERAQKVLAHFDETLKSEILILMGQINTQPSSAFRDVALRLSNKLPEFEGMKDISIDGIAGVMNILDTLTDDAQIQMLAKIEERAPQLATEIKKLFIGFNNIIQLDDIYIERAVRDIDTTEIIQALSGYNKFVQDKVINTRPTREQLIIKSQLEENNNPLEAGILVRRKIILSIRNQLKAV
ncbi:MAG: FliG C-terminal domain-containing protein [Bacteroidota bacterium]